MPAFMPFYVIAIVPCLPQDARADDLGAHGVALEALRIGPEARQNQGPHACYKS